MFKNRFKKFGGEKVDDIIEYTKEYIKNNPGVTISIGCDSIQRRKRTVYACTVMFHNKDVKNGAHVLFFRENIDKVRDNHERLHKEAEYALKLAEFFHENLVGSYERSDISEIERKRYKFHIGQCTGEYSHVLYNNVDNFIKHITLTDHDKNFEYKLVDIHIDFNPFEGTMNARGMSKNKSNAAYNAYVPWMKGMGYRVYVKPDAAASTSAADLLCQES